MHTQLGQLVVVSWPIGVKSTALFLHDNNSWLIIIMLINGPGAYKTNSELCGADIASQP